MNILKFNDELSEQEKFLDPKLPKVNMKFRNQFCATGSKVEYSDLSKVKVNTDKMTIIPKIFSDDREAIELDFIGLYSIGVLESLYLGLCTPKKNDLSGSVTDFGAMFNEHMRGIFKDFNDIEKIYDTISSFGIANGKYNEAFNLYFMMRTHYDRSGHHTLLKYADWLMVIWLVDPQTYWEIFFDIMEYVRYSMLTVFSDYVNPNINFEAKQPWLSKKTDLCFEAIEYNIPGTEKIRKITDCRGISMMLVWSLYYRLIYNYGFDCEKNPAISYHDDRIIKYIDNTIKNCIGDDQQAKAIKGKGLNQAAKFNSLCAFVYDQPNNVTFTINNQKFVKHYYEEIVLFMRRHNTDVMQYNMSINMHYSNIYDIFAAVGEMFYLSSTKMMSTHEKEFIKAILELEDMNKRLLADIERQKKQTQLVEERYKNSENDEIESLKKQLEEAQALIESKNSTIDALVTKNKELNKSIATIYDDDFETETEEVKKTIEEMVQELNDYKIVLIGGRFELPTKLNEYGWMNIRQYDNNNLSTGIDAVNYADFIVINTRFVNHTIVNKVESMTDSDIRMLYNGTNPEKLIEAMYDFVMKYFYKE